MKFQIPSDFASSRDVQEKILHEVEKRGFDGHGVFAIKLALEEAMINAIKHGNKLDRNKQVIVEAKVTAKEVTISIEDEGPGFDRSTVPDPTAIENLCKVSGRGLLLIESYMNSVAFSKQGRKVTMTKLNEVKNAAVAK